MPKPIVQILFNNKMCEREIERNRKGKGESETQRDRDLAGVVHHPQIQYHPICPSSAWAPQWWGS